MSMQKGKTSAKLPKITESSEEDKIQDFCASLKIPHNYAEKKKLGAVRSIFDTDGHADRRPKGAKFRYQSSLERSRSRDGFSKAHLFSARELSKLKQTEQVIEEKIIDLTNIHDATEVARQFYQYLGMSEGNDPQCLDNKIACYLRDFEKADLTFPKLWTKDKLFKCANKITPAQRERLVIPPIPKPTENKHYFKQKPGCEKIFKERNRNTKGRVNFATDVCCVFYSKPVQLKRRNSETPTYVSSLQENKLPAVNVIRQPDRRRQSWPRSYAPNKFKRV